MNAIWRHLVNDSVQSSDDTTYEFDLPNDGALHTLFVTAKMTNGGTHAQDTTMLDVIDYIEVIGEGSQVLYHLTPQEIEKWYETSFGRALDMKVDEGASVVQTALFPVFFGSAEYVPGQYLPLSRFKNCKLRIKYSPTIAATSGFATGTFTVDLMALITPQHKAPAYEGTFILKTLESFTSLISGDKSVELPLKRKLRGLGVFVYEAGIADGVDITRLQLSANSGESNIFDADWLQAQFINADLFRHNITHYFKLLKSDTDTVLTRMPDILNYSIEENVDVDIANDTFDIDRIDTIAGDTVTINSSTGDLTAGAEDLTANTTDHAIMLAVSGQTPSAFVIIPLFNLDSADDYLDTGEYAKLELILTQGAAGAAVKVSTQEFAML